MTDDANEPAGKVPTPCVRNCCLDEKDVCMGCYRSLAEILAWSQANEDEKREILLRCGLRRGQYPGRWRQ